MKNPPSGSIAQTRTDEQTSGHSSHSRCITRASIALVAKFFAVVALSSALAETAWANVDPVINEFVANHVGIDMYEFVEIFGAPDADYSHLTIVEIEGDGTSAGLIDDGTVSVGATDANGYWWTGFMDNIYENGSHTLLLVEGYTGSVGDDLDTDNDGALDVMPWTRVVDGVAVRDGGSLDLTYASPVLVAGFDGGPNTPGGASRIPNGTDTDTIADWVRNDFYGAGLPGFYPTPPVGLAFNTPGMTNKVSVPPPDPVINEFVANHVGTDMYEFVEIFGAPDADYSHLTIVEIEGDGTAAGLIDDGTVSVGATDANGYWWTGFMYNVYENGSHTLLLVEGYTGSVGDDLDTDNDGALDITPWTRVVDGVAVRDGGSLDLTYATPVLVAGFDGRPYTPGGASRIPNGTDTDTIADWVRNDFDGEGLPPMGGTLEPGEAKNTPGAVNEGTQPPLDTTPPEITVELNPTVLWPPNHKMVDIQATVVVTDDTDPQPIFTLVSVTSSEPDEDKDVSDGKGKGDGNTTGDIDGVDAGTDDTSFRLRAERQGAGSGRVYTVVYEATDAAGNTATQSVEVIVPHDQSGATMTSEATGPASFDISDDGPPTSIYPSVFKSATTVSFRLTEWENVNVRVFDVKGRLIRTLTSETMGPGRHQVPWDGRSADGQKAPGGIYMMRIDSESHHVTHKAVLLKR